MRSCLKAFCKATNGPCVVLPAASWSALCQTQRLSRRKVKQHFFPLWRVHLSNLLYFLSSWRLLWNFSAGPAGVSPPTHPVAVRPLAGRVSHITPLQKHQNTPLLTGYIYQPYQLPSHQYGNSVDVSTFAVRWLQDLKKKEKEKSSNEFWLLFSL